MSDDVYKDIAESMSLVVKETLPQQQEQKATQLEVKKPGLPTELSAEDAEALLLYGDLNKLSAEGRMIYYYKRCLDLNLPMQARPFDYLKVPHPDIPNTKRLLLYLNRTGGDLLRENNHVTIEVLEEREVAGYFEVKVKATRPVIVNGQVIASRSEHEIGGVEVAGLSGQRLANARMKAYTKAKRRAAIAICAAGMSDETEIETIKGFEKVPTDIAESQNNISLNELQLQDVRKKFSDSHS